MTAADYPLEDPFVVSADLASALAQMSQVLLAVQTGESAVKFVTALAVETLPGTLGAGVTVVDADGKHTRAASNPLVEDADRLQYESNAGPCITAWRDQVPVYIPDIALETRWPEWTAAVAGLGVRSMLSVPMLADGASMGAIKVYSDQPNAYDTGSVRVLQLFAQQASVLLGNTRAVAVARELSSRLTSALEDRDVIAQATGVLMAQGAGTAPAAVQRLRLAAQRSGTSMRHVAQGILDSISDPPPEPVAAGSRHR